MELGMLHVHDEVHEDNHDLNHTEHFLIHQQMHLWDLMLDKKVWSTVAILVYPKSL